MALALYDVSIPAYLHMLRNLEALLAKAEAHAKSAGSDPAAFLETRLAPDMHPLTRQIQMASDAAKGGAARLAGVTPPSYPDTETTWAEVKERIAKTIAFVESIKPYARMTREDIDKAEKDPDYRLRLADPKVRLPETKRKKGPRYTPVSRRQDADRHREHQGHDTSQRREPHAVPQRGEQLTGRHGDPDRLSDPIHEPPRGKDDR